MLRGERGDDERYQDEQMDLQSARTLERHQNQRCRTKSSPAVLDRTLDRTMSVRHHCIWLTWFLLAELTIDAGEYGACVRGTQGI